MANIITLAEAVHNAIRFLREEHAGKEHLLAEIAARYSREAQSSGHQKAAEFWMLVSATIRNGYRLPAGARLNEPERSTNVRAFTTVRTYDAAYFTLCA